MPRLIGRKHQRPSPEELREAFQYDPVRGELRRRRKSGGLGPPIRAVDGNGYTYLKWSKCQNLRAHLVAYAWVTGRWPEQGLQVDHINGDRTDYRWRNLRKVTQSQNVANQSRVAVCQWDNKKTGARRFFGGSPSRRIKGRPSGQVGFQLICDARRYAVASKLAAIAGKADPVPERTPVPTGRGMTAWKARHCGVVVARQRSTGNR